MSDILLRQMMNEAVKNHIIGKKISVVEIEMPNLMSVTLETGLRLKVELLDINSSMLEDL